MDRHGTRAKLSTDDLVILEYSASGLSSKEISALTGKSVRTVEHHTDCIRKKLHARNRVQMIANAFLVKALSIHPAEYRVA